MKNFVLIILILISSKTTASQNIIFSKGSALSLKNGNPIEMETSHAAPFRYDMNGDGIKDLLVGEFGEQPVDSMDKSPHAYVRSKCRVYLNEGTNANPIYNQFYYLQAGGEDAFVPVTCCISFIPRIVDINGDGLDDIISGDYPGNIHVFWGLPNRKFKKDTILVKMTNMASICAEPIDWNDDGLIDLLVSYRYGAPRILINHGTKEKCEFSQPESVSLNPCNYTYVMPNKINQTRKSIPSHTFPIDFDKDGLFDLVCGDEWGNIFWYKNQGSANAPRFKDATLLFNNNYNYDGFMENEPIVPVGNRLKVWVEDYNLDGKLDIMGGDIYGVKRKIRTLSTAQTKRKKKLQKSENKNLVNVIKLTHQKDSILAKVSKEMGQSTNKENLSYKKKLPPDFLKKYESAESKMMKLNEELKKLEEFEYLSKGYVWLFLQK